MKEILENILIVLLAISFVAGAFYLIFSILKSQILNAKKWGDCRRWARSQGYALPKKANPIVTLIGVIIGLFIFILPGLIVIYMSWRKNQEYQKEMRALMNKWIDAGKPLPKAK